MEAFTVELFFLTAPGDSGAAGKAFTAEGFFTRTDVSEAAGEAFAAELFVFTEADSRAGSEHQGVSNHSSSKLAPRLSACKEQQCVCGSIIVQSPVGWEVPTATRLVSR